MTYYCLAHLKTCNMVPFLSVRLPLTLAYFRFAFTSLIGISKTFPRYFACSPTPLVSRTTHGVTFTPVTPAAPYPWEFEGNYFTASNTNLYNQVKDPRYRRLANSCWYAWQFWHAECIDSTVLGLIYFYFHTCRTFSPQISRLTRTFIRQSKFTTISAIFTRMKITGVKFWKYGTRHDDNLENND